MPNPIQPHPAVTTGKISELPAPIIARLLRVQEKGHSSHMAPIVVPAISSTFTIEDIVSEMSLKACRTVRKVYLDGQDPSALISWLIEGFQVGCTTVAEVYALVAEREAELRRAQPKRGKVVKHD